jgi:hypothetical protein
MKTPSEPGYHHCSALVMSSMAGETQMHPAMLIPTNLMSRPHLVMV